MTDASKPKLQHHHVWRHYLSPWGVDGQIWCLQDRRVYSTGTRRIAVEKRFYKLEDLTPAKVALVRGLIRKGNGYARDSQEAFMDKLLSPFRRVQSSLLSQEDRDKVQKAVDDYASQVIEDYHTRIEGRAIPFLDDALNGDLRFYEDERCIPFLHFLATQYMRTKGIKERVLQDSKSILNIDSGGVWVVLSLIFAENLGASLYAERHQRKLALIRNDTAVPFVTGDQPAINIHGERFGQPPGRLSIYYPISPRLALQLCEVDEQPMFPSQEVKRGDAAMLNQMMAAAAFRQVFAQTKQTLLDLSQDS